MSGALSLSLSYIATRMPSAEGTNSALTPEREVHVQLALVIAFLAVCIVAWVLRPESPPDRRSADTDPQRPRRVMRRR